ncbi:hypothetical protein DTO166G4_6825 [Paecilomyces variotii]|uniref:Derlin n=1 Tax=Byssochlamys spectabilis TaxID=264951 RepID=A0A443I6M2_BYSSP|nr:Der1-like family-domain-containing protein [Paecilomyces variotii]KAJ9197060.1 hypothetical protein DTO032I3_6054 [Paecilomyces variotii]KAJ9203851.1 hypothetical protein DTO164E3_2205 [Paecilomyces variotii]KAJ9211545.1 hypothetical protein DTO166G4_6825 [Paecilomyces variotii]KAJ9225757.1 hypothetical protein DTO169C6_1820 [Paecilomyces variotii]KAJ9232963.1 hypothetical protein DTO166G5_5975 [Paecilomyces variotii]
MDIFWAAPPISRTITALTFVQSALFYGGLLSGYHLVFLPWNLLKLPPQIWRLATPFFLTGPNIGFLYDLYFMYTYSSALENDSPLFSMPGDYFIYVIFVGTVIVLTAGFLLGGFVFTGALILAFAYTYAQENRGKKVRFFIINIPVVFLPWAILALTLVTKGGHATAVDGTGILAAHLYQFLVRIYPEFGGGRKFITTPGFVQRWFGGNRQAYRTYGTAYRPPRQPSQASSGGWSSSFTDSWSARGAGRRLGGD